MYDIELARRAQASCYCPCRQRAPLAGVCISRTQSGCIQYSVNPINRKAANIRQLYDRLRRFERSLGVLPALEKERKRFGGKVGRIGNCALQV
jgi:hypothetical protein